MDEKLKKKYKRLLLSSARPIAVATLYFLTHEDNLDSKKISFIYKVTEKFSPIKKDVDKHSGKHFEYIDYDNYPKEIAERIVAEHKKAIAKVDVTEVDELIAEMNEIF